jgi:hypothetical protein
MNMENINIEQVINKWFEMKLKTYDRLEYDDSINLYYEGQEYADIRIHKKFKLIYYKWELYEEFSEIIPLHYSEFEEFMIKWVEDTFGLKGFTPYELASFGWTGLKIPLV